MLRGLGGRAQAQQQPSGHGGGLGDILGDILQQQPQGQAGGQSGGLGDILGEILRRQAPESGEPMQQPQGQQPGGDILGQILRDMLGGGGGGATGQATSPDNLKDLSDLSKQFGIAGKYGEAMFGDMLETGGNLDRENEKHMRQLIDEVYGSKR
jgi:hypothetical protein